MNNNKKSISIIGAPTDVGTSINGSRMGPQALRIAGIKEAIEKFGVNIKDVGDLIGDEKKNEFSDSNKLLNLNQVIKWNKLLYKHVLTELNNDSIPLILGGDHSLAIGSISAAAKHCKEKKKKLLVLWFDAHSDFNTIESTPSGNIHGMPVACLFGLGNKNLNVTDFSPVLNSKNLIQVGIRSVDPIEKKILKQQLVKVIDMRLLDEIGISSAMNSILSGLTDDYHIHVSYDLDFLDPNIAPGVSTPVRGGANFREAQLIMELIADSNKLGSIDILELNPTRDIKNNTAKLAVDLIESLFGKSTLERINRDI